MNEIFRIEGELPREFRPEDVLAFHRRDPAMLAERVEGDALEKGLVLDGVPSLLRLRFTSGGYAASLFTKAPGLPDTPGASDMPGSPGSPGRREKRFAAMIRRMLGLPQDVAGFAAQFSSHPEIGPLVRDRPQLRVPCAATPFEALAWAIAGQQISVQAALSLRRGYIEAADVRIKGGLLCHPDAAATARLGPDVLGRAGFSRSKARALLAVCDGVLTGSLDLEGWAEEATDDQASFDAPAVRAALLAMPGVGPWTADYVLLRGFGHLDGSLHGDAAVRRGLKNLFGRADKITQDEAQRWLSQFTPYRALAAAHLWAAQSQAGY